MASPLNGKWKLDKSDKFDEYLQCMGINFMMRKLASTMKPEQTIEINDKSVVIKISAPKGTQERAFEIDGPEVEQKIIPFGAMYKFKGHLDGGKVVIKYEPMEAGKKPFTETREVIDDELVMIVHVEDIVCTRHFKRIG